MIMITVINPSKYSPLSGSFANEWTLSIIPERTIKAPNKINEKTKIDNNSVHTLNLFDFIYSERTRRSILLYDPR